MSRTSILLIAAVAGGLLGASALAPGAAAAQQLDQLELPGVDVSGLTPPQLEVLRRVVAAEFCYCGCPHTLEGCLREHKTCKHAPRMAELAVRLAAQGLPASEVKRLLDGYYAGFDRSKRARLDVKDFGPPRGNPLAPVAIVEFSDFTCPFCQRLKPELDRFVENEERRVRFYYKPFPIASHQHAKEAALAGEWARDQGLFWKMYDSLFAHSSALSGSDLAGYAEAIGGDPDDLHRAIEAGRGEARVAASRAEARAAGITGTPTLYVNGRKLDLPLAQDLQDILDFTVEDEEEWVAHGGWTRD